MKRLSLLVVAMLLATASFAQVKKSPAPERYGWDQEYPLYGEVKSVTISHYDYVSKFGKNEKGELKDRETYFFNSAGDVERHDKDGEYSLYYKYDAGIVEVHKYNNYGTLEICTANKCDENGRVLESAVYDSAGVLQTMTFNEYDSEDNHIGEIVYDSSGTVTDITCYEYNEQGDCTSIECYDSYESLAQENSLIGIHQSFTYDSAGNIDKCLISGSLHSICLFHYDANGNLVEMECRKSLDDSLVYKEILSYDESGDNLESIITYEPRFDGRMMVPISITEYNIVYVGEEAEFTFADFEEDEEESVAVVDDEQVFVKVERMPSFAGGDFNTFRQWFCTEFKYPAIAVENGIQGTVVVKFIIEKDGRLTNIEFLQSPDPIFNDEVIRVLKMSPKWTPGYQGDKPVRVSYVFPIRLNLN